MIMFRAGNDSEWGHDRLVSIGVNICVVFWMPRQVNLGNLAELGMSVQNDRGGEGGQDQKHIYV